MPSTLQVTQGFHYNQQIYERSFSADGFVRLQRRAGIKLPLLLRHKHTFVIAFRKTKGFLISIIHGNPAHVK